MVRAACGTQHRVTAQSAGCVVQHLRIEPDLRPRQKGMRALQCSAAGRPHVAMCSSDSDGIDARNANRRGFQGSRMRRHSFHNRGWRTATKHREYVGQSRVATKTGVRSLEANISTPALRERPKLLAVPIVKRDEQHCDLRGPVAR